MQANATSDSCQTDGSFEKRCQEMFLKLETEFQFHKPDLTLNMRNSTKIKNAAQGVQTNAVNSTTKIGKTIPHLPTPSTSVEGPDPVLIPIHKKDFDRNAKKGLKEVMKLYNNKCLILCSSSFKGDEIRKMLINHCDIPSDNILVHDSFPSNATKEELKSFVKNPQNIIGIFQSRFVPGMEGSNIIYFYDERDENESTRCTMTRAVNQLTIFLRFSNNTYATTFKKIKINTRYLRCPKTFTNLNARISN